MRPPDPHVPAGDDVSIHGSTECVICVGDALLECPNCGGEGDATCECQCGHVHYIECSDCEGDGTIDCWNCDGAGRLPITDMQLEEDGQMTFIEKGGDQ